jgi:predicted dehydrogenase
MINRREFLGMGILASTAMATLGAAPKTGAPVRCGFLGIDHAHALDALKVVKRIPDYDLVGVCEPDAGIREAYARKPELDGVPWLTRDELLNDDTVQLVAVESDVPRLLEFGRAAIDAGKHIHLDKAPGTSLPEFRALLDQAEKRGLLVQMGYMFRYNPGFDLIRRALRENWLGDVYSIHASMCTSLSPAKRKQIAHHPGGAMLELGCHLIDMIVLLMGAPPKVTPFIRHDADLDDALADNTLAVFEYDKAMVTVDIGAMEVNAFSARRFKICGTAGSIILSPVEPPKARVSLEKPHGDFKAGVTELDLPDLARHVLDFQDLARCIRGEAEFAYSKEHDYNVQETVLRACGAE